MRKAQDHVDNALLRCLFVLCFFVCYLSVWLASWLAGVGWVVGWLVGWLAGWLAGWLVGWLCLPLRVVYVCLLACLFVGWLVGCSIFLKKMSLCVVVVVFAFVDILCCLVLFVCLAQRVVACSLNL